MMMPSISKQLLSLRYKLLICAIIFLPASVLGDDAMQNGQPEIDIQEVVDADTDMNTSSMDAPADDPASEPMDEQSDYIARAMFTSEIVDREPTDDIAMIGVSHGQLFYFTELRNLTGQTITHRWEYNGKIMADVEFDVGAARWRVYSSKNLLPEWSGEWTVNVLDNNDTVLKTSTITVTAD